MGVDGRYAARQVSLDRVLALKMIPDGPGSSEADLRRFRLEAEAVLRTSTTRTSCRSTRSVSTPAAITTA